MTKPKAKGKPPKKKKIWAPILLVRIYRMAKAGLTDKDMCKSLGVTPKTFIQWKEKYEELREALSLAQEDRASGSLSDWIYQHLTPEIQQLWDRIIRYSEEENGIAQIKLMMDDCGKTVKQQLFLYALCTVESNFNPSSAMRKVCVTKKELDDWCSQDPNFNTLIQEIEWHKDNFFEDNFIQLVREKNPGVVALAARTRLSKRGYGVKVTGDIHHTHEGNILHGVMDLTDLYPFMSPELRTGLMEAMRLWEKEQTLTPGEKLARQISNPKTLNPIPSSEVEVRDVG